MRILIVLVMLLLFLSLASATTIELNPTKIQKVVQPKPSEIKIINTRWNLLKASGLESNFTLWTLNNSKKTEIGFILSAGKTADTLLTRCLYYADGTPIKDDKNKDLCLKYETAKCGGLDCYHLSLTSVQAVNINNYIKLGNSSAVIVYQDIKTINYDTGFADVNITLYKNISNTWDNTVNSIFVFNRANETKFGANDSENIGIEQYKYTAKSTSKIYYSSIKKYLVINSPNLKEKHYINFIDICNKTEINADCKFKKIDNYNYEVVFFSDKNIDPTITIGGAGDWNITNINRGVEGQSAEGPYDLFRIETLGLSGGAGDSKSGIIVGVNLSSIPVGNTITKVEFAGYVTLTCSLAPDCTAEEILSAANSTSNPIIEFTNLTQTGTYTDGEEAWVTLKNSSCLIGDCKSETLGRLTDIIKWAKLEACPGNSGTAGWGAIDNYCGVGFNSSDYFEFNSNGTNLFNQGYLSSTKGVQFGIVMNNGWWKDAGAGGGDSSYEIRLRITYEIAADVTKPTVNLTYPQNTTYNINISTLNYTCSDTSSCSRCWYSRNGGATNSTSVSAGTNFTSVTSIGGSNIWYIYCNDTSNNVGSSNVTFYKNTIPPWFINIAKNQSYSVAGQNINFSVTIRDDILVDRGWFSHNFDLTDKESIASTTNSTYYSFGKTTYMGQTFRFANNEYLRNICFKIYYSTGTKGDVYANIYNVAGNIPTGTNLSSPAFIDKNIIITTQANICVNFTNPIQLIGNTFYAIILSSPSSSSTSTYRLRSASSSTREGGRVSSTNNGTSWSSSTYDLIFNFTGGTYDWKNETKILVDAVEGNISQVKQLLWASDSPFSYMWCGNDTVNNQNCSSINSIYNYETEPTDTIFPTASILSPMNNTKVNGNLTIDGTASDNMGINYVSFQYKNSTNDWTNITGCAVLISPYDCIWTTALFSNATEGYDIKIVPCDTSGNCNTSTSPMHYIIDRKVPIDLIVLTPTRSVRNSDNLTIRINTTDGSGAGINDTGVLCDLTLLNGTGNSTLILESGSPSTGNWSLWNITVTLSGTTTGLTQIPCYINDNATPLNNMFSPSFSVQIDNDPPTYSDLNYSPQPIIAGNIITFQVHAFDNINLSYYIFSTNITGTWQNITTNFTGIDNWAVNDSNVTTEGGYNYYFVFYDEAGNFNQTTIQSFTVSSSAVMPLTLNLISPPDESEITYYSSPYNITFAYNYTGGDASSCKLYIDSILNLTTLIPAQNITLYYYQNLTIGTHTWYVECNDSNNDNYPSDTWGFTSALSPLITVISPQAVTYTTNTIDFNVSLNTEGSWCAFALDDPTNITMTQFNTTYFNYTLAGVSEGSHAVIFYCNNTIGDVAQSSIINFAVDTIPPTISLIYPLEGTYITYNNNIYFNFTATDVVSGIDTCELWGNWTGVWHKNQTDNSIISGAVSSFILNLSDGIYKWNVWCNDTNNDADWSAQGNQTFTVASLVSVSITYPQAYFYRSVSTLNYTLSVSNLQSCWYSLDNGATNTTTACSNGNNNVSGLSPATGNHTWVVWANNSAGKIGSDSVTFRIDATNPLVTINLPQNISYSESTDINITLNETGNCNYTLDGGITNNTLSSLDNLEFTGSLAVDGSYILYAYCEDLAGNQNNTERVTFYMSIPSLPRGGAGGNAPSGTYIEEEKEGLIPKALKETFRIFDYFGGALYPSDPKIGIFIIVLGIIILLFIKKYYKKIKLREEWK